LNYLKFASIDIGSNAVRFLLSYVFETSDGPFFRKGLLVRVPLRLGEDSFRFGRITKDKEEKLIHSMHAFKHLMLTQDIVGYKALATSAMRDASNNASIVNHIEQECGIVIEVISGEREANVISGEQIPSFIKSKSKMLFVDVGGGSTELAYHNKTKIVRESFNIGTIRSLYKEQTSEEHKAMEAWLKDVGLNDSGVQILGSGGNINKIYKIRRKRATDLHISDQSLKDFYQEVKDLTNEERIIKYQLNPDRADVIVPACEIFLSIINQTKTKRIFVPKTGLSDGIVRNLYKEYKARN
jgi:exopolyphosphatase/guanosine-5'-triphosphate,3'-diphosphate pyrophosphatase